ncbi:hypothetical protein ACIPJM_00940 [Streptomyces halstedii]|uniref:hypothetical protein n=1 Tax=Streptomyces halstedii TaxID=1944 RepID=UPI003825C1AD
MDCRRTQTPIPPRRTGPPHPECEPSYHLAPGRRSRAPGGGGDRELLGLVERYPGVDALQSSTRHQARAQAPLLSASGRLRFRVNARPVVTLRRTADVLFTKYKVAVFVDGCYWHGCSTHRSIPATNRDFWVSKIEGNKSRDRETDSLLVEHGWFVVRVWEHTPIDDAAALVRRGRPRTTRTGGVQVEARRPCAQSGRPLSRSSRASASLRSTIRPSPSL